MFGWNANLPVNNMSVLTDPFINFYDTGFMTLRKGFYIPAILFIDKLFDAS